MRALLLKTAEMAAHYLESLETRGVPPEAATERLAELGEVFPQGGTSPEEVLRVLDEIGSPATVGRAGPTEWQGRTAMRISVSNRAARS